MKRIAIVEDEAALRENYKDVLQQQGYSVQAYANRPEAMRAFNTRLPDLAIIDIGLEYEIDGGFTLCQSLRAMSSTVPIIFLTARDSDFDTVCGLRLGADDYLSKDVSFPHLIARLAALFRRSELKDTSNDNNPLVEHGLLSIDINRMQVYWSGIQIELTVTEFWMVHALARRPGHVRQRQELMQEAKIFVDDSTITSHVKRIRKKFLAQDTQFNCIDTVYGMGYRWDAQS
ncbi:proteobacterial dedicated sortase system response regulator [Shewanella sp. Choline-02u-19]|jgi:two-component system OmpR family response regulator|uniref:proteobacterial dedicated sortase system response regulator n=1 Tax=unclassified Shewanella TaxID=196818 RepID=UPI000C33BCE1|nr:MULTISPECIES: proteobacterial dedicated sortase system response regulator [unclassified Shewanella]PKG56235.1 proteobacterial dedicated sortase system response regulator [Shewanella sp. GutDb-MelDb]PKG75647.1 proteobacterial dedicated sortase system response regulator [Shewanella sp. GutCb]PKH56505.1 proteobacterial dedicated sortase system response regulator [Shewanella sp. Bg11-22]PKI27989.1 proteobacterial dedicated sortase system response regulator [Shewanella sp. Choline-02u-19]